MSNPKQTYYYHQHHIGKTDSFQNITATVNNHKQISFSPSNLSYQHHPYKNKQHYPQKSAQQKQQLKSASTLKKQKNVPKTPHKKQTYFWPTDIIKDKSGQAMRCLKSYLQKGKVNSYIKLHLSKLQKQKLAKQLLVILQNIFYQYKKQYFLFLKQIIQNNYHTNNTHKNQTTTNNNTNTQRKKITQIDYQIINLSKNNNQPSYYIPLINNTNKTHSNDKKTTLTNHDTYHQQYQTNKNFYSYIEHRQNKSKYCSTIIQKPSNTHSKTYLTPNTSTYLGQTNTINQLSSPKFHHDKKIKITQHRYHSQNYQKQIYSPKIGSYLKNNPIYQHPPIPPSINTNYHQHWQGDHECYNANKRFQDQNINIKNKTHNNDKYHYSNILEVGNNVHIQNNFPDKKIKQCGRHRIPQHHQIMHEFNYI